MLKRAAWAWALAGIAAAAPARAEPPPRLALGGYGGAGGGDAFSKETLQGSPPEPPHLQFEAGQVTADAALGDVLLERGVSLRWDRYRLRAERLRVQVARDAGTLRFDGDARLALCPCDDPPLAFAARGGRFDPPGDLFLKLPRVELFGAPIFALPFLWLRAPDQPGLLPPILAIRSRDGALLGGGVHLPWSAKRALDLTLAGYTGGGVQIGAELRTEESRARALVDEVRGRRVLVEARGAIAEARGAAAMAWEVDALRGDRGRSATPELGPAARAFDTGAVEASLRGGSAAISAIAAGALMARGGRGEGPIVVGPRASVSLGGPIAKRGSWSADAATAVLGGTAGEGAPLARASVLAEIDARPGPIEVRASTSARGRFAGEIAGDGASREIAAAARLEASLPLLRSFAGGPGELPITHWIAPILSVRGALADVRGGFFQPIEGRVPPASWIAAGGLGTAVGRYAGPALRLDLRAGAAGDARAPAQPLLHARLGADARLGALALEAAAVGDAAGAGTTSDAARGHALIARGRVGDLLGPWISADAALQGGAGAGQARAIASGAWARMPGDELAYLSAAGLTFGAEISVPLARVLRAGARADLDLARGELLSVRGVAEYRHGCGCLGVGLTAAHRAGREGVDVALVVDVAPRAPR